MGANSAWQVALDTLDAVELAYADAGLALPARRYVTAGNPADDCDQLVVWLSRIFMGVPGQEVAEIERVGFARTLELFVRSTRCVQGMGDEGQAPNGPAIQASTHPIAQDLIGLPLGLARLRGEGLWLADCQALQIGNCSAFEWSGQVGGCELRIEVQLDADMTA